MITVPIDKGREGSDRPPDDWERITSDQAEEMVQLWGQENMDKLIASGNIVVEGAEKLDQTGEKATAEAGAEGHRPRRQRQSLRFPGHNLGPG